MLRYRCQRGKELGQQCHRLAEKEGYCLHCIYNDPLETVNHIQENSDEVVIDTIPSPNSDPVTPVKVDDNVSGPIIIKEGDELPVDVEIDIEAQTVPQSSGWFGWLKSFVRKE